jgi:NADH dehydrogenase
VRREDGVAVPPTAQHALRQAEVCAANVVADLRGGARRRFAFDGLGKLASLGRRRAVAEVFGIRLTGLPAWLVWRGVYATKFPGLDRQVRLLVDWALDAVLPRDVTELRAFHEEPVHREHFEPGETVFAAEDLGDKVYFVAEGEAAVLRDGRQVALLRAGDVFGEQALLSDRPRSATVRARTPLDVVAVSRDAFHELLGRLPGLGAAMDGLTRERSQPVLL